MGLYISLKKRIKDADFNRFKSAFYILDGLFKAIKIKNRSIAFYKDYPLLELNKNFKRIDFDFGLLESSFRKKLQELGFESNRAGFEIEGDIILKDKKFRLIYELLPRNKSKFYDIRIGLLPNGYAEDLEDLESGSFYPKLREYLYEKILQYNKEAESKRSKNLFLIKRALISEHKKEFHNIDEWSFFYSKEPEEFINNLFYGDKDVRERLLYANREKFAEFLRDLNQFIYKMYDYAEKSQIVIKDRSIAIIPKDKESMKEFINKLKEKVALSAKEFYLTKDEMEERAKKIFED